MARASDYPRRSRGVAATCSVEHPRYLARPRYLAHSRRYKQYKNRFPPANGCPQDAFDYGPDGGCGCYDDDLWHMTDGDEEVTCDNITYEQCKMKSDEY